MTNYPPAYFLDVKSNTPEALQYLASTGWYPGKNNKMNFKAICIEAPKDLFPTKNYKETEQISFAGAKPHPTDNNKIILFLAHPKNKTIPEGKPAPIVGEIKRKR